MRQGSLQRWIAVLFLLFAAADISVDLVSPQVCCDELSGLVASGISNVTFPIEASEGAARMGSADDHSMPGQPLSTTPIGEECFCCCSHILPSLRFEVAELNRNPLASGFGDTFLPVPPPQNTYHPPRLS